jgi:hypothetical protein
MVSETVSRLSAVPSRQIELGVLKQLDFFESALDAYTLVAVRPRPFDGKAVKVDGEGFNGRRGRGDEEIEIVWLMSASIAEPTPKSTTIMALRFACFA